MTDPTPDSAVQETFLSHLFELRTRLLRSIVSVVVVLVCLFPFAKDIYALLAQPLLKTLPAGATMIATDVTGTFLVPLKVTLMAAFLIALPYVLWQAWAFVAPGLYHHEKRLAVPVIVSSVVLFFFGMAFAYFFVFPVMFSFFAGYTPVGVTMMTDIDKYLSFVLAMFLAFGMTFEVPVIVIVLVRLGVVSLAKLRAIRSYVIVGAFVVGAVFTPPDVLSQLMLARAAVAAVRTRALPRALRQRAGQGRGTRRGGGEVTDPKRFAFWIRRQSARKASGGRAPFVRQRHEARRSPVAARPSSVARVCEVTARTNACADRRPQRRIESPTNASAHRRLSARMRVTERPRSGL